ncbi:MAG: methylmalonyl Co-A mutase-associated GTPase MeaB, partial [Actinomycetes bacterium]
VMPGISQPQRKLPPVSRRRSPGVDELVAGIFAGERALVSQAITLVESNAPAHRPLAREILRRIGERPGFAHRVGISGVPGAGKSTFIEALGNHLCDAGRRVAVLAVDPSSSLTRGSILGDKTRMETLSRRDECFIRPSPSGGALGGVTRKTRETIAVCEAAGFDVVIVETVGVGQNEVAVRSMVDFFLVLMIAGAGDEMQGIKKGVIELADAIVEVTETGSSLRAHSLRILDTVLESNTQLIANTASWQEPRKRAKIGNLALMLRGALEARGRVGLMLNVRRDDLDGVLAVLPALNKPTVAELSDGAWVAVNTVIEERRAWEILPQLKSARAEGIVEYPLNKVVS